MFLTYPEEHRSIALKNVSFRLSRRRAIPVPQTPRTFHDPVVSSPQVWQAHAVDALRPPFSRVH